MRKRRRKLRAPLGRFAPTYDATGNDGFLAQGPFTAAELTELRHVAEQIKNGRKDPQLNASAAKRKLLDRLEREFVAEFHNRNIFAWFRFENGPFVRFKKLSMRHWCPIFT